ncbi:FAD-dependent monooxygenase [Legionella gresilensis]|uniref:FAD-dependent monooxygenase n=1 Tax=Legionella gresilensis TaxID=91823 RepID=UPI0010413337|nr:FAD-dependent monooxygenase [Legionella gresilensis]
MVSDTDVLIVGAGPTGLMLALELARQKINFRIIDKKAQTSQIIKATALSSIALEGFDDFGYASPFIHVGNATQALVIYAEGQRVVHAPWLGIESKYPNYFLIGQNYIEKFQEELLNQLGSQVEWQVELKDFMDVGEYVQANLEGKQKEVINCRYLIGCDGAHSLVQDRAKFTINKGKKYPSHYIVADVSVQGDLNPKHWYLFFANKGFASLGCLPDNRWGVLISLPKSDVYEQGQQPTLSELQNYFDVLSPISTKFSEPRWISHFHTYLKLINNRRKGRIILCGDAAHQVSPLTSLGMNSGLLDARNLGWKLALQCQGVAADRLLDSYSEEQRQTIISAKLLSNLNEKSFGMTGFISREYRDHVTKLMMQIEPVKRYFGGLLSQSNIHITRSSIIDTYVNSPIRWLRTRYQVKNSACLQNSVNFKGLKSGERAPDVYAATLNKGGTTQWLFENRLAGKHSLFIFLSNNDLKDEMLQAIDTIIHNIHQHYNVWINLYLIISKNYELSVQWKTGIIFDEEDRIHKRYGAISECLYLIRPDRFVGFRSMPPCWNRLEVYLKRIFKLK